MTNSYLPRAYDIFVGIDVDKTQFAFTIMDHHQTNHSKTIPADPQAFFNYLSNRFKNQKIICAYEAGPTGFHLYDFLTLKGIPCLIVSPASVPKPPNQKVKTNKIDSKMLARLLKNGELKSIRIPSGIYRELRHLVKIRQHYIKLLTATKHRIKSLLLYEYLHPLLIQTESYWSNNYIRQLRTLNCSYATRHRLDMLLADLDFSRQQILIIHKSLKQFAQNHKLIASHLSILRSIDGIGFVTAFTLLGKIGDPLQLQHQRELSAFAGLVPREHSTGEHIRKGRITHLGDPYLRSLLVEAAWIAIKKNASLKHFFDRIKKRHHHKIGSQKAIVAVARKLTQIIFCVLKEQRLFVAH